MKAFERFMFGVHELFLSLTGQTLVLPLPEKVKHENSEYKNISNKRPTIDLVKSKNG